MADDVQPTLLGGAPDLEAPLPAGHRTRMVWGYVERANLSRMYAGIRAVEGCIGRAAITQEILLALRLYTILEGVAAGPVRARAD